MSKINVSICIPAYNSAKTIRESIESALAQEYPLREILVVDDFSTDNTVEIAQSYPEVRVVRNFSNLGIGKNLIKCMESAFGKYIVFLCSDDLFADRMVVSDIAHIFNHHANIGVINRYYYQFMNGHRGAVMEVRGKDLLLSAVCPSGMAMRNIPVFGTNKIFIELPTIVAQYLGKWEWTTMEYDTVAVRLHAGGNTGTMSSYYTDSPVKVLSEFLGKDFKYHLGLVQLKNRAPKILWQEIRNTIKINPKNLQDPFFWFCAIVAVCTPQFVLRHLSDFYRHRINRQNCTILKRKPAYPIYPGEKIVY